MEYKSVKGLTGWGQLGILIAMLGGGFILAAISQAAILIPRLGEGYGLDNMADGLEAMMNNPGNALYLQLAQVVGTFCLFFIPAYLYLRLAHGKNMFWLGFNKYFTPTQIALGFLLIFTANLVASPLADMSKSIVAHFPSINAAAIKMEEAYSKQLIAMSNLNSVGSYILALFIIAFFPAVFEELFFRGALQNLLVKWWKAPLVAIIFCSLIFSLIHGSIFLFLSRFILGLILGLLYHKSKNIWVNIIAHFLNNGIAVTAMYVMSKDGKAIDPAKLDPSMPWWVAIIGVAALIALFYLFDKISKKNVTEINLKEQVLIAESQPFHDFPTQQKNDGWA